jgi:cytochrome c
LIMVVKLIVSFLGVYVFMQVNHPPDVKISDPKAGVNYQWNVPIAYKITVSDKEDGDSRFDEIPSSEVLLEVRYIDDTSVVVSSPDKKPLQAMMSSNCMNCHAFGSRLIGPSFMEISSKYDSVSGIDRDLVKRVREGSSGIWGSTVMPTHPELSEEETAQMVKWILDFPKYPNVSYYTGTEGSITIKKPAHVGRRPAVLLTASYLDRGKANGEDTVLIHVKD